MSAALEGRTALVTGAGRGIGRSIALAMSGAGARLAILSRTPAELEETAAAVTAAGGEAPAVIVGDMVDPDQIVESARRAATAIGPLDVLVNNAAVVWPLGASTEVSAEDWEEAFQINVFGPMRLARELLGGMVERRWGRVVNVSSGIVAHPGGMIGGNAYAASKAALEAHSVNLAAELDGSGVTVNAYRPGAVDTAMQGWIRAQDPDEIGAGLHERFVSSFESGALLTPERSAAVLLEHLEAGGSGQVWDVPA